VVREVGEELALSASDFSVARLPAQHLEYRAHSRSAGELTAYTMELFEAQLTPQALAKVEQDPRNKWLCEAEIRRLEAHDARPVSVTMHLLLSQAGKLE
jgi:hypothetical protein